MYTFRPRAPNRRCTVIQRAASTSSTTADAAVTDSAWPAFSPEWCSRQEAISASVSAIPRACAYATSANTRSCRGVRFSAAATGSHTNASIRDIDRTVRTADCPAPPGSVRRCVNSSTTPSGPGRRSCFIPRSTEEPDSPRYDAIVSVRAWQPSGRDASAFTFTYTDSATSAYNGEDTSRIGTFTRCRRTGTDAATAADMDERGAGIITAAGAATELTGPPGWSR
ncbi:hypothetical protein ACFQFR_39415 [Streptomyces goshikiensis]